MHPIILSPCASTRAQSNEWAYCCVNTSFRLCPTYGRYLVAPSALNEEGIKKVRADKTTTGNTLADYRFLPGVNQTVWVMLRDPACLPCTVCLFPAQ